MRDAFLHEIIAHPDDLSSRRAFADWLMEQPKRQDQEQGEFISLQLELDRGYVRGWARQEMEGRQRELLTRYRDAWEWPFRGHNISRCVFRRGMVETIALAPDARVTADWLTAAFAVAPITGVIISRTRNVLAALDAFPQTPQIASLTFTRECDLRGEFLSSLLFLPGLIGLRELVLDGNRIGDEGLEALANWPGLRDLVRLGLRATWINPPGVRRLLRSPHLDPAHGQPALRTLDLRNRNFTYREARDLLAELALEFSPGRLAWVERLLAGILGQPGRADRPVLVEELWHANEGVRRHALQALGLQRLSADLLRGVVRRFFEPGCQVQAGAVFFQFQRDLKPIPLAWVRCLLEVLITRQPSVPWLDTALANTRLPLPPVVQIAFADLCGRRLSWRAGHGRAEPVVPGLDDARKDRQALRAQAAVVAEQAAAAAARHTPPERDAKVREQLRQEARNRESAWLASWLLQLLQLHELEPGAF